METKTSKTIKVTNNKGDWITYGELLTFLEEISKEKPADNTKIHLYVSRRVPGEFGSDTCSLSITYEV